MAVSFDTVASDATLLGLLGTRLQRARLDRNLTQARLADEAGVSVRTIKRLEAGESTQLTNLLRVLRALDLVANLEQLVPEAPVRPRDELGDRKKRQRARPRSRDARRGDWKWGDES